jgi:hypothetical protein
MSVIRGRPADICSMRVLRILTTTDLGPTGRHTVLKKPSQQPGVFFCDRGIAISEVRAEGFGVTVSCSHDEAFESG